MTTPTAPIDAEQNLHPVADTRTTECPFFDESQMSPPTDEYVCWIDVMGSQSIMLRSLRIASNFLMKLHVAALRSLSENPTLDVKLYPIIDGIYACSPNQGHILYFLKRVFSAIAVTFILETEPFHRFEIRGGLAYGPIVEGEGTIPCADELTQNPNHAKCILLGPTLAQAYRTEEQAAPFGIALHESVRTFAPLTGTIMPWTYWKWWKMNPQVGDNELANELLTSLRTHYDWCLNHTVCLSYSEEDIKKHRRLLEEYFSE